jgi:hypothetical protein
VRLEKRWSFLKNGYIAFVAEVENVTLRKEKTSYGLSCKSDLTDSGGTTQCMPSTVGPLTIPSLGVEASF